MKRYLVYVFIFFCITTTANAQKKKMLFKDAINSSRDSVRKTMARRPIPGAAITVSINGEVVWSEGFGFADLEQQVPASPSKTKFRIGSISKALTATGLARLYENHKIILDSSVFYYLPDYPMHQYRFTVRQLAGHLAGIRHYKGDEWTNAKHYSTVTEGLTIFKDDTLLHRPGTKYQYTSHGFNLLSAVIEKVAGKDFLTYMNDEVLKPLQLKNTTPDLNDSIISYRSRFYEARGNHWVNSPYVDNSYKWGGGGFISTAEDINKFGASLLRNDFLRSETIKLFTTPQLLENGTPTTYGMGFASGTDNHQRHYFGHSGGSVGGTCDMVIYPNEKVVVVILTNVSDARLGAIARVVATKFMDASADKK